MGLGYGVARLPEAADATKKRKRKRREKKAKPNAFGCLEVGDACKIADQCCSGICEGQKGERTCRAHGNGTCNQKEEGICKAVNPALTRCNTTEGNCLCFGTTAGSNFCANPQIGSGSECAVCKKDADCEALGFPPGFACTPVTEGNCFGLCESGKVCVAPCGIGPPIN